MSIKLLILFFSIFISVSSFSVHNPVLWSDVPDIDMIRVEDTYYMISTTMFYNPGAPIMKSKDLASWEICNYVYDTLGDLPKHNLQNNEHDYGMVNGLLLLDTKLVYFMSFLQVMELENHIYLELMI